MLAHQTDRGAWRAGLLAAASAPAILGAPASGQDADAEPDRILVTGSYIERSAEAAQSPISIIDREQFELAALQTPDDLLKTLTLNSGSVSSPDTTNAPFQVGTAQFNLRGLGLASTLTLINGRRQVVSPIPNDDGSSFVDINTLPLIMIDRVEVLKDGAAALYGSDAVAGVANFIMRDDIDGLELNARYQVTTEDYDGATEDDQSDTLLSAAWGGEIGPVRLAAGLEYIAREPLEQTARPFSNGEIITGLGFPGAFAPTFLPVIDPNCAAAGGIPTPFGVPGSPEIGLCGTDLTSDFQLISEEERLTGYALATAPIADAELTLEAGFASNSATVRSSPSFPNLKFPSVPANNPGNLVANGGFGVPVVFFGRALSNVNGDDTIQGRSNDMMRLSAALEGPIGSSAWTYALSGAYARQEFVADNVRDVKIDRFQAALNGVGGPNNNQFFNPFGSSVLDPALANDPAVIADFLAESFRNYESDLTVAEAVVSGPILSAPGGDVILAAGGQVRTESLSFESDEDSRTGNLVFLFTGPNFSEDRTVSALFAEAAIPLTERVNVQAALRYEQYPEAIGESLDPKISVRWDLSDALAVRGSAGTSFRAPSLSQTTSISTINGAVEDPLNPSPIPFFRAIVTQPNANLAPEESVNYTLGAVFQPTDRVSFSIDYWRYDYEDIIVKQSAQAIINADPNDPRIIRQGGLPNGQIAQVQVSFVNANAVDTDGFDVSAEFDQPLGRYGDLSLSGQATLITNYTANVDGQEVDLLGKRNFQNFARPLPEFRANLTGAWRLGGHELAAIVRHISGYEENTADPSDPANGFEIDPFTTVDVTYAYRFSGPAVTVRAGVINAADALPPETAAPGDLQGFDRLVHDPLGRRVFAGLSVDF